MSDHSEAAKPGHKADGGRKDFDAVFDEELNFILERKRQLHGVSPAADNSSVESPEPAIDKTSGKAPPPTLRVTEHRALTEDLCGLALSGGGIRSATFSLGVLQGLAAAGLLKHFDYLSTVSGGGYIGAWLSAWIRREGIDKVEKQLCPPALRQDHAGPVEPEPIRHLRLYSNYLAPRPGLFSFDGWTLIAIYLRNLLLNQLVLVFFVFGLFAAIRLVVECFSLAHEWSSGWLILVHGLVALLSAFVASCGAAQFAPHCYRRRLQPAKSSKPDSHNRKRNGPTPHGVRNDDGELTEPFDVRVFWAVCIAPLVVAGLSVSLMLLMDPEVASRLSPLTDSFKCEKGRSLDEVFVARMIIELTAGLVTAVTVGAFLICGSLNRISFQGQFPRIVLCGLGAGLLTGTAFGVAGHFLASQGRSNAIPVAITATAGVPLFLASVVLGSFLMTGLRGYAHRNDADSPEIQREWWSSVAARLMMVAVGWFAVAGCVVFGPWLLAGLWRIVTDGLWSSMAGGAFGAGWLATLAAGIRAAQMPVTGPSNQRGLMNLLARVAPPLFLTTLLMLCTVAATWVMYDIHAWIYSSPEWGFAFRQQTLLTDLNDSKIEVQRPVFGGSMSVGWVGLALASGAMLLFARRLGRAIGPNVFSLQRLYRNRLVRCYLGASNASRNPEPLVNLDDYDDLVLSSFFPGDAFPKALSRENPGSSAEDRERNDRSGPFHIINGALNQKASTLHQSQSETPRSRTRADHTLKGKAENLQFVERQADSFVFTPLYCGSTATGYRSTHEYSGDIKVGEAIAVSGAAVSPNMGYHSSPAITALLTVFNIRLGGWFPNPSLSPEEQGKKKPSPFLLLQELAGMTDAKSDYVYVSDGGHFENMGVYELIRRRCRFILAVDAGSDPKFHENVGRVVRQVRIDFGIWIEIDMKPVSPGPNGLAESHVVVGRIHYGHVDKVRTESQEVDHVQRPAGSDDLVDPTFRYGENQGIIIWLKNSLTGDEPGDLVNHAAMHPEFPYDSTLDQFFNETQFESYRALGMHSVLESLMLPWPPYKPDPEDHLRNAEPESPPARESANLARQEAASPGTRQIRSIPGAIAEQPPNDKLDQTRDKSFIHDLFEVNYNFWITKPAQFIPNYIHENEAYVRIQQVLRQDKAVKRIAEDLYGGGDARSGAKSDETPTTAERLMANEMFTLLENVWLSLDLERNQFHPVHDGWMTVFRRWTTSPILANAWRDARGNSHAPICLEYSPAFQRFIDGLIERSTADSDSE